MVNNNNTNRVYCSRRLGGRGSYSQEARLQRDKFGCITPAFFLHHTLNSAKCITPYTKSLLRHIWGFMHLTWNLLHPDLSPLQGRIQGRSQRSRDPPKAPFLKFTKEFAHFIIRLAFNVSEFSKFLLL